LYFYHQQTIKEAGMGNCKTEVAHANVHQLLWLLPLMEDQSVYHQKYYALIFLLKQPDGEFKELK